MHPSKAQKSFSLPKKGLFSSNLTAVPEQNGSESSFIVAAKASKSNLSRFATQPRGSSQEEEIDPKQINFPASNGLLKLFQVECDEAFEKKNNRESPAKLFQQSKSLTQQSERQFQSLEKKRSVTPFEGSTEKQDNKRNLSFSSVSVGRTERVEKETNKPEKIIKLQEDSGYFARKETKILSVRAKESLTRTSSSFQKLPEESNKAAAPIQTKEIVVSVINTEAKGVDTYSSKKIAEKTNKEIPRSMSIIDCRARIKTEGDRYRPLTPNIGKDKDDSRSYEKQSRYGDKSFDKLFKVRGSNLGATSISQDDISKDLSMTSSSKKQPEGFAHGKLKLIVENILENKEDSPRDAIERNKNATKAVSYPEFSEKEPVEVKQSKSEKRGSYREGALAKGFLSKINGCADYQGAKNLSLKKIKFRDNQIKDRNSRALYP